MFDPTSEAGFPMSGAEPSPQARELDEIALRLATLTNDSHSLTGRLARLRGALVQAVGEMRKPPAEW